jgi:hypothetical protein
MLLPLTGCFSATPTDAPLLLTPGQSPASARYAFPIAFTRAGHFRAGDACYALVAEHPLSAVFMEGSPAAHSIAGRCAAPNNAYPGRRQPRVRVTRDNSCRQSDDDDADDDDADGEGDGAVRAGAADNSRNPATPAVSRRACLRPYC